MLLFLLQRARELVLQLIEQKELEVSVNVYFKAEEVGQDMTPWKKLHDTVAFRNSWDVIKYCSQYCYVVWE